VWISRGGLLSGFLVVSGDRFTLNGDRRREVRLKGTNFQTPYHPHFFFRSFDFGWVERGMEQVRALGMNCVRQLVSADHNDAWRRCRPIFA